MLPLFSTNTRRRQINLGGAQTSSTSQSILTSAKQGREQRIEAKRRSDASVRIQSWWRGVTCRKVVREQLERVLDDEVKAGRSAGPKAVRCLLVIRKRNVLDTWAKSVGPLETQSHRLAFLLLENLTSNTAKVLSEILSRETDLLASLIQSGTYYSRIGKAIRETKDKKDPVLPFLISLVVLPFSQLQADSQLYAAALKELVQSILSVPILPNRIPIPSLTQLSSKLPVVNLHLLSGLVVAETDDRINILANLLTLTPPRYSLLPAPALSAYLILLADLLNALPVGSLNPQDFSKSSNSALDSDDEDSPIVVSVVSSFQQSPVLPTIDPKTLKRLHTLMDSTHLSTLLKFSSRSATCLVPLTQFILALTSVWPTKRETVFRSVLATYPAIIRELYRSHIRSTTLERGSAAPWVPVVLVAQLYAQALLTMGDDEFFGSGAGAGKDRNPLSLDELRMFSKQLMGAVFDLYWRPPSEALETGMKFTWLQIRDAITKCLIGIHSRDSRKPFTPQDHWLVNQSQIEMDMGGFVEAALFEEEQSHMGDNVDGDIEMEDATARFVASRTPRKASRRTTAYLTPRLGILNNIPFAIPFDVRVSIFRCFVLQDSQRRRNSAASAISPRHQLGQFGHLGRRKTTAVIRRGHVAEDGFDKLGEADLRKPVEIVFIDQWGQEEAGIDGGGVFKEFFTELCKEAFDTDRGLWLANKKNELYPSSSTYAKEAHSLNWYRFVGRILGKAMYEGILVDVAFAGFFLARWLGRQSFLDDLESLDPDLYNGLIFLKHYEGNVEDLSLNFTAAIDEFGVTKPVDLIPSGSQIPVTRENRLQYIQLISHFRLSKQIKTQSEAFFEGLEEVVDGRWLRMFNQQEVQILIGGVNSPIDLDDLRKHTNYGGLYDDNHETIVAFWDVVNTFNQEERRRLLRFVTSCSRPPLLGFKELTPNFSIRDAGSDQHRLPTSSTCVNLLKLPRYGSEKVLRQKVLQAINAGAGFDLS